ncbi:hypothetical protein GH714_022210 [Hevea brasiliensis]|uniref:O-methyltransferase domain-containing protein n=1 Tax=Hevea brasiliensis TaxID=3981 RepID=A0A6A6M8N5_HEVBR|nr:hypothetical protein GH714_022210 [Hevea brasiliensis]
MERQEAEDPEGMLRGQAAIWDCIFGFVSGMALKCVVELGIPDIINSHGCPLSLSSIAKSINHPSLDTDRLSRNYTWMLSNWHHLSDIVKEGGSGFAKCHDLELFDFASTNPEFNTLFNEAMEGASKIMVEAVKTSYKDGFNGLGSLVDVGAGLVPWCNKIGNHSNECPKRKLVNIVERELEDEEEEFCEPDGDDIEEEYKQEKGVYVWILHDWNDEYCIKILKNCRKALPKKTGKLIMVDAALNSQGNEWFDYMQLIFDLAMMVHVQGKERSEAEWKIVLEEGGFASHKIITIPAMPSITEAYP